MRKFIAVIFGSVLFLASSVSNAAEFSKYSDLPCTSMETNESDDGVSLQVSRWCFPRGAWELGTRTRFDLGESLRTRRLKNGAPVCDLINGDFELPRIELTGDSDGDDYTTASRIRRVIEAAKQRGYVPDATVADKVTAHRALEYNRAYEVAMATISLCESQATSRTKKVSSKKHDKGAIFRAVRFNSTPQRTLTREVDRRGVAEFQFVVPRPDIVAESLEATVTDQSVDLDATLCNRGTANTGDFDLDLYQDRDKPPVVPQPGDQRVKIKGLAPNQCVKHTFVGKMTPGRHQAWILGDSTDKVVERNEENNAAGPADYVIVPPPTPKPDLIVRFVNVTRLNGGTVTYDVDLCNIGKSDSPAFSTNFYFHRTAAPASGEQGEQREHHAGLRAGQCDLLYLKRPTPPDGKYRAFAYVDYPDDVAEANERNNEASSDAYVVKHFPPPLPWPRVHALAAGGVNGEKGLAGARMGVEYYLPALWRYRIPLVTALEVQAVPQRDQARVLVTQDVGYRISDRFQVLAVVQLGHSMGYGAAVPKKVELKVAFNAGTALQVVLSRWFMVRLAGTYGPDGGPTFGLWLGMRGPLYRQSP